MSLASSPQPDAHSLHTHTQSHNALALDAAARVLASQYPAHCIIIAYIGIDDDDVTARAAVIYIYLVSLRCCANAMHQQQQLMQNLRDRFPAQLRTQRRRRRGELSPRSNYRFHFPPVCCSRRSSPHAPQRPRPRSGRVAAAGERAH